MLPISRFSNHLLPVQILLFLLCVNPVSARDEEGNSVAVVYSIDFEGLALKDALEYIQHETGIRMTLSGSFQPEELFTLHVKNASVDKAISKLLIGYDYALLHNEQEKLIILTGSISGIDRTPKNNMDGESYAVGTSIQDSRSNGKIIYNSNNIPGIVLRDSNGVEEFLPIQNTASTGSEVTEYVHLNISGVPEAIPINQDHDVPVHREFVYLDDSGVPEAIPVQQNREVTPDKEYNYIDESGIQVAVPIERNRDVPASREYVYLNNSGVTEAIPVNQ